MKRKITLKKLSKLLIIISVLLTPFIGNSQLIISSSGNLVISSGAYVVTTNGVKNTNTENNAIDLAGTLNISGGNFTNNAASGSLLSGNTGTVAFIGTAGQAIDGSSATYFHNLTINNTSAAGITHTSAQSFVSGTLTLTDGVINTNAGHELVMRAGSSYTGGSDASHIDGPMQKVGSTNFSFPVGNGGKIAEIGIEDLPGSNTFTAQYFKSTPTNYTQFTGTNIHAVSGVEYWDIHPASGSPQINLRLAWNSGTFSGITDPTGLLGAHYNSASSTWEEVAYISHTGTASNGTIKFGPITSYSNFTFGSTNNVSNPLPVEMLYFNVEALTASIDLSWATASELNADAFEIQRSTNAIDFETIGSVKAAGNSNTLLTYRFNDKNVVANQDYYYRLKQVDFDGKFDYSAIRMARLSNNSAISINVFPNPTKDYIIVNSNIEEPVDILLYSISGKLIFSKRNTKANNMKINIEQLPSDLYVLKIVSQSRLYKTMQITKL